MMRASLSFLTATTLVLFFACSDEAGSKAGANASDAGADGAAAFNAGVELRVPMTEGQRVGVRLDPPSIVTGPKATGDLSWDLAFEGLEVYTNSGPSGSGIASAFGPLDSIAFLGDAVPDVPFTSSDKSGGAFIRWYYYSGPPDHALFSRYHVFGVKDGDKTYRVQVLGYYGKVENAPVAALYRIRYGLVGQPAQEAVDLDGRPQADDADTPSECIDLGTGTRVMHTPAEARTTSDWQVCFRRENISVNGETGGPRNAGAVDLDAPATATETLDAVAQKTPESELARFDAVNAGSFAGQDFRGDRVVSAFSGLWTERGANPAAPGRFAWLVVGADGKSSFLVGFPSFEGATATSPGTIVMRVKAVK